jgi:hypothetical protein
MKNAILKSYEKQVELFNCETIKNYLEMIKAYKNNEIDNLKEFISYLDVGTKEKIINPFLLGMEFLMLKY